MDRLCGLRIKVARASTSMSTSTSAVTRIYLIYFLTLFYWVYVFGWSGKGGGRRYP